jgi:signal transduction histidine kinase
MDRDDQVNILLVDDQPGRLLSYEAILGVLGHRIVKASSGNAALAELMRDEFAVILLDVAMPGLDGFETAALIHQHPRHEKTPIVFVTAFHVTDLDRLKGYELGAIDYVYVPVVPEILRSKVAVLIDLYRKERELVRLNRSLGVANAELAAANALLEAEKTSELEALNATLARANEELGKANASLTEEVAERTRLEQTLKDADRRKDEFIAMLAHELRNPLAPIVNGLELMQLKEIADPELAWSRDVIGRQVKHLARLVEDLLDVSRITQGKIKLKKERIELEHVLARAIETSRPLIEAGRHRLLVRSPERPVPIEGDATRLAQIVGNLLSNAAKYTHEGGRIELETEIVPGPPGTGEVVIRVRDDGVGIPPEMLPRLFELFSQVERTIERSQGGLGIGLALVRRLVELHGGHVSVASEGAGRGSEFVVHLPILAGAPALGPADLLGGEGGAAQGRAKAVQRVLVVDDNVDSAESLSLILRASGYLVRAAHSGFEALDLCPQFSPQAIVLDLGMAGLDGCQTAERIRAEPWGRDIRLIALTGWSQGEARDRTRRAGFDAHLVKPVDLPELFRHLRAGERESRDAIPERGVSSSQA